MPSRGSCIRALVTMLGVAFAGPYAAAALPPSGLSYTIEARLDPAARTFSGREEIRWTNPTDETLAALPLHLYLNAFSHTGTTWLREEDISRFELTAESLLEIDDDPWGWIEPRAVRQRGAAGGPERDAPWRPVQPDDGNPLDRTLAEVTLPEPVPPRGETVLVIEFEGKLPVPMARTGGRLDFFLVAQWYPKIGVIEPAGTRGAASARSAARQFHSLTEFYADFADYDVTLILPEGWMVGGTGRAVGEPSPDGSGGVRHRYRQRAVHDAAFVTGRSLSEMWRRVEPAGGGPAVDVRWIVPAGTAHQVDARLHPALVTAMDEMSRRLMPYPYDVLTVSTVPWWAGETAGMEYPTFFTGDVGDRVNDRWPRKTSRTPEMVVIHEYAHQYFYGLVASNEQEDAVLDEGFTQYWEMEIARRAYGERASQGHVFGRALRADDLSSASVAGAIDEINEPMRRAPTSLISAGRLLGPLAYHRPALTLDTAARLFGRDALDQVMAEYVRRYAFRHPSWDDFLEVARTTGGAAMAGFLDEAFEQPRVPDYRVEHLSSSRWESPLGRVVTGNGPVLVTPENEKDHEEALMDPAVREDGGLVMVEITDPGWHRAGAGEAGRTRRARMAAERPPESPQDGPVESEGGHAGEADDAPGAYESTVRLEGPGWDHLPVEVEFGFDDGVVVRDTWDGRAAWRTYRFVRRARLVSARMDPQLMLRVDPRPQNNSRALDPDAGFVARWAAWFTGLAQWAAAGASLWL